MKEESTTHLNEILNQTIQTDNLSAFIEQHSKKMPYASIFSEYLAVHPDLTAATLYRNCMQLYSKSYIYDILNGRKANPSRDAVLTLCIAAGMNRKETRRCLASYGHRDLYPKDTRDIILATCINRRIYDLTRINEELTAYHLPLLGSKNRVD